MGILLNTARRIFRSYKLLSIKAKIRKSDTNEITISYAGYKIPTGKVVTGGWVKLQHLDSEFKGSDKEFNILYLVSSALPANAQQWIEASKSKGIKVVWNQNGVAYPAWAGNNYSELNNTMKSLIHKADYVFYQSEFCKKGADIYLDKFEGNSSILYNCVNTELFKPENSKRSTEIFTILVAGSHHQRERVTMPLETLRLLIDSGIKCKMIFAGRYMWKPNENFPNVQDEIKSFVRNLNLENYVEFRGGYLQENAAALFNEANVLFHFKFNDPCPTVPIESMACGTPVIASNSGGLPELLGNNGGILLPVEQSYDKQYYPNPQDAFLAVKEIMKDWDSASKASRNRALTFNSTDWIKSHESVFRDLIR